ncbi:MAG TPA: helix-turn-helix domain-containing protein [Chitinophagaceae bacterium]
MLSSSEDILLFISGFGLLQSLILAGLLYFHPRSDRSINKFLALFIICISVPMCLPVLQTFLSWQAFIFIAPFTLLIGPSLYFYIRGFKEVITWKKAWPHLILFFVYIIIIWRLSLTIGSKYPPTKNMPEKVLHNPITILPMSFRILHMLVYYFLSRNALISYRRSIRSLFSETSRIELKWVSWLLNGYLVPVCGTITLYVLLLRYPDYFNLFVLINAAVFTPYIYVATIKGLTQPTVWQIQSNVEKEEVEKDMQEAVAMAKKQMPEDVETVKKQDENKFNPLVTSITGLMEQEKIYQEPDLTLRDLAEKLQVLPYQVSQAINDGMNKSFYDLVNGYRVEEAKRLLLDPGNHNYTILSVGFEAGFNSKTTFNTVFKKFTGMTPTEFREKSKQPAFANS